MIKYFCDSCGVSEDVKPLRQPVNPKNPNVALCHDCVKMAYELVVKLEANDKIVEVHHGEM